MFAKCPHGILDPTRGPSLSHSQSVACVITFHGRRACGGLCSVIEGSLLFGFFVFVFVLGFFFPAVFFNLLIYLRSFFCVCVFIKLILKFKGKIFRGWFFFFFFPKTE